MSVFGAMTFAHIVFDDYILLSQVPVIISDKLPYLERKRKDRCYSTSPIQEHTFKILSLFCIPCPSTLPCLTA